MGKISKMVKKMKCKHKWRNISQGYRDLRNFFTFYCIKCLEFKNKHYPKDIEDE